MKTGTRIQVQGWTYDGTETWEDARIGRVMAKMLPLPAGYHPVNFNSGGSLLVHSSRFRAVANR